MSSRNSWSSRSTDEASSDEPETFVQRHAPRTESVVTFEKFPGFPTLSALLSPASPHPLVELVEQKPPADQGLFKTLLGDRLEELADDIQRNPDGYDDATKSLVERLLQRREELSAKDRPTLDRAVLTFLRPPGVSARPQRPVQAQPKKAPAAKAPKAEEVAAREAVLPGEPAPYWWLK